jgi:sterol desaturase/sphingolipid hydroxylase (fatty acid hydroxylase superfamily)
MPHPAATPAELARAFVYFGGLTLLRYVVFVGLWSATAAWLAGRLRWRPWLQAPASGPPPWRRELLLSACTIVIAAAIAPAILWLGVGRFMPFYRDVATHGGWAYFAFSIVLMLAIRDTLFYWCHRAMHDRRVFRFTHRSHHLSTHPNPLTSYAVSPVESLFDTVLPFVLILFIVPKHPVAYLIFLWIDAAVAVYGHMGMEIFPRGTSRHWLGRWINTPTAHNWHHASARHNYGFHFLVWDRLMGTLDPAYDQRFDAATTRAAPRAPSATPAA